MLISRKRYKIQTYFQWKTNRKSYMAYRMAPVLLTLDDLEGHFPRSFPLCRPFQVQSVEHLCSILPDFNWQRARVVSQRQLGFLYLFIGLGPIFLDTGSRIATKFAHKFDVGSRLKIYFWKFFSWPLNNLARKNLKFTSTLASVGSM